MKILSIKSLWKLMGYSESYAYILKDDSVFSFAQLRKGGTILVTHESILDFILEYQRQSIFLPRLEQVEEWNQLESGEKKDIANHPLLKCDWLSIAEAAAELNISPSTLYSRAENREITSHRPDYFTEDGEHKKGAIRISSIHLHAYKQWLLAQSPQGCMRLKHIDFGLHGRFVGSRRSGKRQIPTNRLKNIDLS